MGLLQHLLFISINLFVLTHCLPLSDENCGSLDEDLIDEETMNTSPLEYPWTALIGFLDEGSTRRIYKCQGVLLSKRIVITTNFCLRNITSKAAEVILGYWTTVAQRDAQTYGVDEIFWNPGYDNKTLFNVGLLHLDRDVVFGVLIQPICLPPENLDHSDLINKRLYVAGMIYFNVLPKRLDGIKRKSFAHVRRCQDTNTFKFDYKHHICGYIGNLTDDYTGGAGLMDVKYVNSQPKYFYLVGIDGYSIRDGYDGFVNIIPSLPWIKQNIDLA